MFKVLVSHSPVEPSLDQLHSAEATFNSNSPNTEGPGKRERERGREKKESGGYLGASPTVPLSKDNFIIFYWQATAFSMPFLLQLGNIFFGGEEAGVFGGEASPPTSPSRLSLESVRQSGLCSPLATPPHEHNLRHCICHIVIRILYLPFPLWVASIYVDRVACHSVCWGGFSQARVNTSLLNWYTIKYYSWFCVGKYLQGTFTLGNTLQTSLAEGISLPTNLHL